MINFVDMAGQETVTNKNTINGDSTIILQYQLSITKMTLLKKDNIVYCKINHYIKKAKI
jgi:hypothetical protein